VGTRVREGLGAAYIKMEEARDTLETIGPERKASDRPLMTNLFSRRDFVRSGALVTATFAASNVFAPAEERPSVDEAPPIRLGLASNTFATSVVRR
jgi:hypothetical protein